MSNKSMKHLDHYDRAIIHYLYHTGGSSLNSIAEGTSMSWITAQSHISKLEKMGYVSRYREGKSIYWDLAGNI